MEQLVRQRRQQSNRVQNRRTAARRDVESNNHRGSATSLQRCMNVRRKKWRFLRTCMTSGRSNWKHCRN